LADPFVTRTIDSLVGGDQAFPARLAADAQAAGTGGVTSTPGFLIGRSAGTRKRYEYSSLSDPSGFEAALERALKGP
jgi:hypothetical protein